MAGAPSPKPVPSSLKADVLHFGFLKKHDELDKSSIKSNWDLMNQNQFELENQCLKALLRSEGSGVLRAGELHHRDRWQSVGQFPISSNLI